MTDSPTADRPIRRPPPPFRRVSVVRTERLASRLVRVTVSGTGLAGFAADEPAASVRFLFGPEPAVEPEIPEWTGNEFLLADGSRPVIRTLTPRRWDEAAGELSVDIVDHGHGPMSTWAASAEPGWPTALSGTGRGYTFADGVDRLVLIGDESAVPAMGQLSEVAPTGVEVVVHVVAFDPSAEHRIDGAAERECRWTSVEGIEQLTDRYAQVAADIDDSPTTGWWVAGEAAAVQRVRKLLFDERGVERSRATVRGYWKRGRAGD